MNLYIVKHIVNGNIHQLVLTKSYLVLCWVWVIRALETRYTISCKVVFLFASRDIISWLMTETCFPWCNGLIESLQVLCGRSPSAGPMKWREGGRSSCYCRRNRVHIRGVGVSSWSHRPPGRFRRRAPAVRDRGFVTIEWRICDVASGLFILLIDRITRLIRSRPGWARPDIRDFVVGRDYRLRLWRQLRFHCRGGRSTKRRTMNRRSRWVRMSKFKIICMS